ncbi:transcriptional regulator, AbrB family [Thermanaeromonas toyohensis ToBE]|uniref:Transcriptional regulator, AbrB family n=1 Tax=Thermanaeromonas toyohensis ToBE TaxID=698762 RepID=A0A1W1VIK0_9FIRM|nr:AbrB/MazE/SpoVT family DNA-binding domain-containing protein [Thermanaeromonas toyohensis]SMB93197.1 transcriptional regulator, AbrB family [Thermanaeromonas toyohensis ToBE]
MYKVTISEKGQISIPVALRRRYGLKKGDKLVLEEIEGAIVIRPLPRHPLLALRGKLKGGEGEKLTDLLLKERAADREREST